jgi:hypothetical protein
VYVGERGRHFQLIREKYFEKIQIVQLQFFFCLPSFRFYLCNKYRESPKLIAKTMAGTSIPPKGELSFGVDPSPDATSMHRVQSKLLFLCQLQMKKVFEILLGYFLGKFLGTSDLILR